MKKNVFITLLAVLLSIASVSAQSFLKKIGDAAKKITQTEEKAAAENESAAPLTVKIESTRVIGDQLLISGKLQTSEDVRLTSFNPVIYTPDGESYPIDFLWWGGKPTSLSAFDLNLVPDINYSIDMFFQIKSKTITDITSLAFDIRSWTAQKNLKFSFKNITVPNPADPELQNPSVIEISKDVYLRWTTVEETNNSFKLSFIVENKGSKDQEMQFRSFDNAKIVDSEGNTYDCNLSLRDGVTFPVDTPVAGNINVDKPVKLNQISLLQFLSRNFNYRIKKIVIPAN